MDTLPSSNDVPEEGQQPQPSPSEDMKKYMEAPPSSEEEPSSEQDPPPPLDGVVETRDENGVLTRRDTYAQGVLQGECLVFNEQEKVRHKLFYHEGQLQGETLIYNDEGDVVQRFSYDQGILHGMVQTFDNKILISEIPYVKGVREGIGRSFAPNGQVQTETTLQKDKETGLRTTYNPETGHVVREEMLQDGVLEGQSVTYYPGGQVMMQQSFEKGLAHGQSTQFYENGQAQQIADYEKGVISGAIKQYTPKGKEL